MHTHTPSLFFSSPPSLTHSISPLSLSWVHQTKDEWEKSTARQTRGKFFLDTLPSSWLKMVGIFSTRLIAVCSLWTPQPWSTSQMQTGTIGFKDGVWFKIQRGTLSPSHANWPNQSEIFKRFFIECSSATGQSVFGQNITAGHWLSLGRAAFGQRVLKIQRTHPHTRP